MLTLVAAVAAAAGASTALAAEPVLTRHPASEAPRLVQAALDAELAGDLAQRAALLAKAIGADAECDAAHWLLGQVRFNGQWCTPEEVQGVVASDPRWAEYRTLRNALSGTPEEHVRLAEWCGEHGLANEEPLHWARVLLAWPDHPEARRRLSIEQYGGALFTHEQVVELEQQASNADANLKRFKSQFARLCREAVSPEMGVRTRALAALRAVNDPAAIDALELAAADAIASARRGQADLEAAIVTALAGMPQHTATLRLLNHAVFSNYDGVSKQATQALKARPQTDYVPLLLAALKAPLDVQVEVFATPDGGVRMLETVMQDGPDQDAAHIRSTNFETEGAMLHDRAKGNPGVVLRATWPKRRAWRPTPRPASTPRTRKPAHSTRDSRRCFT